MKLQVPEACLVTFGWLVCSTEELEEQHSSGGACDIRDHCTCMESQRGKRSQIQDAGRRPILSQSIVGIPFTTAAGLLTDSLYSWSRQLIEHEKANNAAE